MFTLIDMESKQEGLDPVIMVLDFWDQPRSGIALRENLVVRFQCSFDHAQDDYSLQYLIRPISEQMLSLELEAYELYCRHAPCPDVNQLLPEGHPIFPEAKKRYDEIQKYLASDRTLTPAQCESVEPHFQRRHHDSKFWSPRRLWSVQW